MNNLLEEFVDFAEGEGFNAYAEYSGRGMFGRTCFGLVGRVDPNQVIMAFIQNTLEEITSVNDGDSKFMDLSVEDFNKLRLFLELFQTEMYYDAMGTKMIYYWPKIQYEQCEDDDDDEE